MLNEIMLHINHFEQKRIQKINERETRFGVPDTCFPQSMKMDEVTIRDAFDCYYLPLWARSLADYLPEDFRFLYFDCCILTSVSNAVRILRETIGVDIGKPAIDIHLCEELRRMHELKPRELRRSYAGRLHEYYAALAPRIGLRHQLNTRLVACCDIAAGDNII